MGVTRTLPYLFLGLLSAAQANTRAILNTPVPAAEQYCGTPRSGRSEQVSLWPPESCSDKVGG
jgi:hypothetical protein